MRRATWWVALGLVACGGGKQSGGGEQAAATGGGGGATTAMGAGSVSGVVRFTGTAPANPAIDMAEEPSCKAKYATAPTDPQVVVAGGKLGNVFVYVKTGLPAGYHFAAPTTAATIDQSGCLYHPRVFGAMVGQKVDIKNSDPLLHNIKAVPTANRGFNISQPSQGMTSSRTFDKVEVMVPLQCNVHGWMHAWVGVLDHPFFAASGPDGTFTITGLPAGTYTLEAWHEKFGTRTVTVTVPATGSVKAEFAFTPTPS